MKFIDIEENVKVTPGEYILHSPTNQIVLCGAFNREIDKIRVLAKGKMPGARKRWGMKRKKK